MLYSAQFRSLDPIACQALAWSLGSSPKVALLVYALRHGTCTAYTVGPPDNFEVAVVEVDGLPAEPIAFASDSRSLWRLLSVLEGWQCVLVELELATQLGNLIEADTGHSVRYYGEVGFILGRAVTPVLHESVRLLGISDLEMLQAAPNGLKNPSLGAERELLTDAIIAGAIIDGQLVATAHAHQPVGGYAELGVHTLEPWRQQGLSTAAATLVVQCVQDLDGIPVWSTGEDNRASQRVAQKLGFAESFRRCYVIRS